jgi:ABC-type polysaccharide/polyol phosphate transport system ATPase subunit
MGAVCAVLVMNTKAIELHNVSVDYPLEHEDGYSLKNSLLNFYAKAQTPKAEFFRALHNVSLEIVRGEKVGIIGLNGAGKSTILRVMSGIFVPSAGNITVHGNVSPLLDFATGFERHLTGIENIQIRLLFLGLSKKEVAEKISEIVEFSELGDFIHQQVRTYSSGMFIRLAFAVSTSIDPEILIADEIIGAGDAQFAAKAKIRLEQFLSKNSTVVLSSHSMDLLRNFCNRVIWIHKGEIVADGTTDEIVVEYEKHAKSLER